MGGREEEGELGSPHFRSSRLDVFRDVEWTMSLQGRREELHMV